MASLGIFRKNHILLGLSVFWAIVLVGSINVYHLSKTRSQNKLNQVRTIFENIQFRFESKIDQTENALVQLSYTVSDNGIPLKFEETANRLLAKNPHISSLELLPNGVITYMAPKVDSAALGFNILKHPTQKNEAIKSIEQRKTVFAGPTMLVEGGYAVIGRLPIFKMDTFWGFASALIKSKNLEKIAGITEVNQDQFNIWFTKFDETNNTDKLIYGNKNDEGKTTTSAVFFPEGNWKLHISPKTEKWFTILIIITYIGVLAVAVLLGYSVSKIAERPKILQLLLQKTDNELEQTRNRMDAVFTNSSIAIAFINLDHNIWINFSKSFRMFFGYSIDEFKHINPLELLHGIDKNLVNSFVSRLKAKKEQHFNSEIQLQKKNGEKHWVELVLSPLKVDEKNYTEIVVLIEDINDKKEKQLEMAKTSEKLGKQNDRLLNFAYIVSHNLRKHTSNITGIVNLIKYEFLTKQNQTLIDKLDFSSEALNQTVYNLNDVLNFSFNDDISTEPLNLKSEFDKAQKLFESEFEIENATLNLNDSINVEIPFNRSYLESIIYNFISNAFKYAKTNVDLVIDVRVQQTKDTIKLFVQDNGIGIDLEMYGNKIFGMYNRFHNKVSGKGIGLFITKMQIEALDGSIDVQSELNKGTTFIVTFKKQLS